MGHNNSVFNQLQQFLPNYAFNRIVSKYEANKYIKKFTCKNQLNLMMYAQLTQKDSLRDIESGLKVHNNKLYHLGIKSISKSSLSRVNKERDYHIFEDLFYALFNKCKNMGINNNNNNNKRKRRFKFKYPIYALDSSYIDLCLSLFPWAKYQQTKGAIKIHPILNLRSQIPEFMVITDGKHNDVRVARDINRDIISTLRDSRQNKGFNKSILTIDKQYIDYKWLYSLNRNNVIFVTKGKKKMLYKVLGQHKSSLIKNRIKDKNDITKDTKSCCLKDEVIEFIRGSSKKNYPKSLRRIEWFDRDKQEILIFITNDFNFAPSTIENIYKARWEIESFFKWIKQNLKIKTFFGTSKNAVKSQIWITMITYLLLLYIRYQTNYHKSLLEFTRTVREALFINIHLIDILGLTSINIKRKIRDVDRYSKQLDLFKELKYA